MSSKVKWMVALVVAAVVIGVAVPVVAQELAGGPAVVEAVPAMADVPGLVEVITMLAQGLGVGAILAFLFEDLGWFQHLSEKGRWWLIFGVSVGLPVVAQALLQFVPADVWAMLEPYWKALASGFLAWAGSQVAHLWQKAKRARAG
jgi:hypothetical protein